MITSKVIKMEQHEADTLKEALETLEQMTKYLDQLQEKCPDDSELYDLWDDCDSAYSSLWDFIQTYKRQFAEEDRE